nr:hypothetical protein Itr_chr01CG10090 [Ipomoea trifida]
MQPYEEENTEDMKNKILARIEELEQEMTNIRKGDSFDSDDDDKNCFDTCENNSFVSLNDNDGLESFTFGDESLSNEHVDDLHEMLCGDDEMNVDASLHELNDVEIVTFLDNCLDDALYIHELIGEDKEETGGDLRDVVSSKEEEGVEKENVKEEVEDKKKTSDESVREEDEEKDDGGILSSTIGPLPPCSSFREGRAAMAEVTGMRDQRQGSAMALSPGDEAAASFFPIPGIVL